MSEFTGRRSVVLVDDAAEVRLLVRTHLSMSGRFDVVAEGSDGLAAIELARRHRPDLLVLDVSMPHMDGLEALPLVKQASPDTHVVMYTGFGEEGLATRAHELGASALIEKSMALDALPGQLASILDGDQACGESEPAAIHDVDAASAGDDIATDDIATEDVATDGIASDEATLAEHLERFREVFEEAAIGMATMTLTGHIVRANRALAALLDRNLPDLVGLAFAACSAEADGETVRSGIASAQEGQVVRFEHRADVQGGAERWVLTTVAPVTDARGRALYLFLQSQDITAQRSAEEGLRQSEERFRLLVEAVEDYAIFMLDPTGHVVSWNNGAQRIKGYSAEEIIGQHFRIFYPEHMQAIRHPEHELVLALQNGHYEEEGWRIRKDGSRFWANVLITAVRNRSGEHVGFAKVTRNIEERRTMLLDLESAAKALAETNRELQTANERLAQDAADQAQFLAVTAHELRTPVSVLSGSANLLVDHWDQLTVGDRADLIHSIGSSGRRLQRLLRDLLTASRLESRSMDLQAQHVDLSRLLGATIAAARTALPGGDQITLTETPTVYVFAEPDRIAQAVDNLLVNALGHGVPPVTVAVVTRGSRVEIRISDSGPGVPEAMRSRLFQRFSTGSSTDGTGLGLFIVRELARAQGGDAWYEPASGTEPAAFVLALPASSGLRDPSVQ